MNKLSNKYKIIIAIVLFAIFGIGMFMYGYGILEQRNQILATAATERQAEYELLKREQKSFEQGQKDLADLARRPFPPADFFSKDTKVVKEIKILEDLASRFGVMLSLSITGTTKTALLAPGTLSEVYLIPYTATIEGSFENLIQYMQETEHLPFVTHTKMITASAIENGAVRAILNSEFYIKK